MNWLDEFFGESTPEEIQKQQKYQEEQRLKRKQQIEEAVRRENLEVVVRTYGTQMENGTFNQTTVLFLCTKVGVKGELDTLGKLKFTVHENVPLEDVFVRAKAVGRNIPGNMAKLLHMDIIAIFSEYRNYGLSKFLLEHFFNMYQKDYSDYPLSLEFMTPLAEYTVRKSMKANGLSDALPESLVQRYYEVTDTYDDLALIETLKKKDRDLFPSESSAYL